MSRIVDIEPLLKEFKEKLKVFEGCAGVEIFGIFGKSVEDTISELERLPTIDLESLRPVAHWVDANDPDNRPRHRGTYIVSLSNMFGTNAENAIAKYDEGYDEWVLCDSRKTVFHADINGYYSNSMNAELTHWMEQPKPPKEN